MHGLSSSSFTPPPLDSSLRLPEIFDLHAAHSPEHPLFVYSEDNALKTLTWSQAVQCFHRAAHIARTHIQRHGTAKISFLSLVAGLMFAGYIPFTISPRNSEAAVAHLLESTHCRHIFVTSDPSMQKLAIAARARVTAEGRELDILPFPTFQEVFQPSKGLDSKFPAMPAALDDTAVILHSSGSTAFPKVVRVPHRGLLEAGLTPYYGEVDFCGQVMSTHAVPIFHMLGLVQLAYAAFTGMSIAAFSPAAPPVVLSPDKVFEEAIATKSTLMVCPPSFLEIWAKDPTRVFALKTFVSVIFGGGPLQPSVGDSLSRSGVRIVHSYGLTEANWLSMLAPKSIPREGWEYFRVSPHTDPVLVPLDHGVFRVYFKKCATHTPAVLDSIIDGTPALNTNDLVQCHPDNPKLWKIFGRQDDQIMHSNGEKTNPVPIEKILYEDPEIAFAVMFGRGQFNAGVLIFPTEAFDPADEERVVEFREKIWPTVERTNKIAPTHSHIFKEMILVAKPSMPVELSAKGAPRRQAVIDAYSEEIRDLYSSVEGSQKHTRVLPPAVFNPTSCLEFVRKVVAEIMVDLPGKDDDLFRHGLQATWIHNSIVFASMNSHQIDYKVIPENFVYSHPTLRQLAELLAKLAATSGNSPKIHVDMTEPIIELIGGAGEPVIILPGATGSLMRFFPLRRHCKGPVWAIQITDLTPMEPLRTMVQYWKDAIVAKKPHGPYRLAAFSASSLHGALLAKMFEDAGEEVSQLAFIDHSPTLYMSEGSEALVREKTVAEYSELGIICSMSMFRKDPSIGIQQLSNNLAAIADSADAPAVSRRDLKILRLFLKNLLTFLYEFYPADEARSYETFIRSFSAWLASIKAPAEILVAESGIVQCHPGGALPDLGASRWGKPVTVHYFAGEGHFSIWDNPRLAEILDSA
ncbi:NRPS-like enzyme [Roridomyces roridus]|uniref:NRPS-like enzyme n=1 Tax=Roridomyces roridus TaxID=1738132 RepID=A0AAD7BPS8_9AGAR|nr:NRPS-like enzyme [Roridomyces roridus]